MRRVSLAALTIAGAGTIHGAVAQDAPVVADSTLTATISQSLDVDTNYNLDEDSPGNTYFGDTRLGIDLLRGTETRTLAFSLDTGIRALQEAEQDFEWVLASPSSARLAFDQEFANNAFDFTLGARSQRVDSGDDELSFDDDLPALPPDIARSSDNTYEQRYDFSTGFVTGTAAPSSIGFRLRASEINYSGDGSDAFTERTAAEGDVFWQLRLNPVLSSVVTANYSYEDADDTEQTEINYAGVDIGLLYEPREEARIGFGIGYANRDERVTEAFGERVTETDRGISLRASAGYDTDDLTFALNASYTAAAPEPRFSGDFRVSYQQLRGTITARVFQDYGLDSEGEDRRVTGGGVGYSYTLNSISDIGLDVNATSSTGADDISDTSGDGDRRELNFTAQYNHAFTDVVAGSLGYRLSQRTDDDVDNAISNRVFVQIGRSFVTGF